MCHKLFFKPLKIGCYEYIMKLSSKCLWWSMFLGKVDCFVLQFYLQSDSAIELSENLKSYFSEHLWSVVFIFSFKNFLSRCTKYEVSKCKSDQLRSFLQIWLHLLKKSLIEKFIFCAASKVRRRNLGFYQTLTMELFCDNSYWLFIANTSIDV